MKLMYSIIIAEDEPLVLQYVKTEIEHLRLPLRVVGTAHTGKLAYELIEQLSPDILFTDIRMPCMDGLELLEKTQENFPYIKCIILSGYADFDYAKRAISLSAADYLLKPVTGDKLNICLKKLISSIESNNQDLLRKVTFQNDIVTAAESVVSLKQYFTDHLCEKINYNALARSMNYSPNHLAKLFEQQYKAPPMKYLSHLRMEKAKYLLRTSPSLSVKEIALEVGWEDQNYFSKTFKKNTQFSPLEYRQRFMEAKNET